MIDPLARDRSLDQVVRELEQVRDLLLQPSPENMTECQRTLSQIVQQLQSGNVSVAPSPVSALVASIRQLLRSALAFHEQTFRITCDTATEYGPAGARSADSVAERLAYRF